MSDNFVWAELTAVATESDAESTHVEPTYFYEGIATWIIQYFFTLKVDRRGSNCVLGTLSFCWFPLSTSREECRCWDNRTEQCKRFGRRKSVFSRGFWQLNFRVRKSTRWRRQAAGPGVGASVTKTNRPDMAKKLRSLGNSYDLHWRAMRCTRPCQKVCPRLTTALSSLIVTIVTIRRHDEGSEAGFRGFCCGYSASRLHSTIPQAFFETNRWTKDDNAANSAATEVTVTSASFSDEISVTSPRKLFSFITLKKKSGSKYTKTV